MYGHWRSCGNNALNEDFMHKDMYHKITQLSLPWGIIIHRLSSNNELKINEIIGEGNFKKYGSCNLLTNAQDLIKLYFPKVHHAERVAQGRCRIGDASVTRYSVEYNPAQVINQQQHQNQNQAQQQNKNQTQTQQQNQHPTRLCWSHLI